MHSVEQRSRLDAPAERVWARAVTEEGINDELAPWLRMTMPARLHGRDLDQVAAEVAAGGADLGRSWILLLGIVPLDFDDLRIVELDPGRRFLERSRTLTFGVWEHERLIEPDGDEACWVTDRLGFELRPALVRAPGSARLARAIVEALFRHRHRRLARFARSVAAGLSVPEKRS